MRRSPDKMNITLMILSAVAVLMALLLFTDAFVPVFPTGVDRPDSEAGEMGEETQKHWWDKIFGKDETRPEESAEIGETPMDEHPRPDLFREPDYYTEAEMKQWKKLKKKKKRITNLSLLVVAGDEWVDEEEIIQCLNSKEMKMKEVFSREAETLAQAAVQDGVDLLVGTPQEAVTMDMSHLLQ